MSSKNTPTTSFGLMSPDGRSTQLAHGLDGCVATNCYIARHSQLTFAPNDVQTNNSIPNLDKKKKRKEYKRKSMLETEVRTTSKLRAFLECVGHAPVR